MRPALSEYVSITASVNEQFRIECNQPYCCPQIQIYAVTERAGIYHLSQGKTCKFLSATAMSRLVNASGFQILHQNISYFVAVTDLHNTRFWRPFDWYCINRTAVIAEIYRKLDNWLKLLTSQGVWLNYKVNQTSSENHRGNRSFRNNLKDETYQQKQ